MFIAAIIKSWDYIKKFLTKENITKLWDWIKSHFSSNSKDSTDSSTTTSNQAPRISTILEDNSGGYSSIRIVLLITLVTVLFFWGWAAKSNIQHNQPLPDIPTNVVLLVSVVGGGKVIQKIWGE